VTGKIIILVVRGLLISLSLRACFSLTAMNVGGLSQTKGQQNIKITLPSFLNASREMKFNWKENAELKNAVLENIRRSYQREQLDLHRVSGTELVNTLAQLNAMGWKINDIPKDALKSLLDAIEHPSTVFTTFQICHFMHR
jgi:hypothetical protein